MISLAPTARILYRTAFNNGTDAAPPGRSANRANAGLTDKAAKVRENMDANAAEVATVSARTCRHRARHRTVDDLDKRSRAGRRAAELMRQFEAEIGGDLSAGQKLAVSRAAVMTAIAEDARVRKLNGASDVTLDDLVRLDRVAAMAVRALGLDRERKPAGPDLKTYLASLAARTAERRA